jgi:hypothetical protein
MNPKDSAMTTRREVIGRRSAAQHTAIGAPRVFGNAMRWPWILVVLTLPAAPALAVEREAVSSIRPLLLAAIDKGEAHGVLTGSAAQFMTRMFKTEQPMEVDVAALHDLAQAGCKRLQVTTTQKGVVPDARALSLLSAQERQASQGGTIPQDIRFAYQISFCRNGTFPTRGGKP